MKKLVILIMLCALPAFAIDLDVSNFGAKGDGKTYCTPEIQKAIDECHASGGGVVNVPAGTYLVGTIWMRDNVELHLTKGATLFGSARAKVEEGDYPEDAKAIVYFYKVKNAAITGLGKIDGNGKHEVYNLGESGGWGGKGRRFNSIRVSLSENIRITDLTLDNPQTWTVRLLKSDGVQIRGVKIYAFSNHNNDGIDVDARNVVISDCIIFSEDDAICFKSYRNSTEELDGTNVKKFYNESELGPEHAEWATENVTVTNCILASNCIALKFGTHGMVAFRNITVSNCVIRRAPTYNVKGRKYPGIKSPNVNVMGVSVQMVDGGFAENIAINNITMEGVMTPIFLRFGSRFGTPQRMKNIVISNIVAESEGFWCSSITGIPGHNVEGVTLRDIILRSTGNGLKKQAVRPVPEVPKAYPQNRMYGKTMPAHGFYVRHAENLTMENIQLFVDNPDERPAIMMENVSNLRLNNFQGDSSSSGEFPFIRLINSKKASISGFRQYKNVAPKSFLTVEGDSSAIRLYDNDLSGIENPVSAPDGAIETK